MVNSVLPGHTSTERLTSLAEAMACREQSTPDKITERWVSTIPAQRLGHPSEIANAVAFLASPAAGYINGVALPVDGGFTGCL
jgi:3-oxoacyl-[acyl-carrier protein] reductase